MQAKVEMFVLRPVSEADFAQQNLIPQRAGTS
jgi:hypothetical protein